MTPRTILSNELHQIAKGWAHDPLRHAQMKTFLASLADHPGLTEPAVTAVRALRDNRIAKQYPAPGKIIKPASRPLHYERLSEGYAKSVQGIGRPWWKIFFGIW